MAITLVPNNCIKRDINWIKVEIDSFDNNWYKRVNTMGFLVGLPLFGDYKEFLDCWYFEEDKEKFELVNKQENLVIKK